MRYCTNCLMPDTRPGIKFQKGECIACVNYHKQKSTDWNSRREELERICQKYRNCNGNGYDCAIAVSGGKDSHFQVYYIKEVMKMNPVLLAVGNFDLTETGRKNLENLSETFSCDIISFLPNRSIGKKLAKKAFEEIGSPTWYLDALIYAYPYRMAMKLGIKFLIYGEDVNYTYGGKFDEETPSAIMQSHNDVVKPIWKEWFEDETITEKELEYAKQPTIEECNKFGLESIYLSYFVQWDSHHNYEVAKKYGFSHLGHEYVREGTIEQYNSVDSISYLLNQYLKYPKYAHGSATEMASRWIRSGLKTRDEMIPIVEDLDKKLDQGIVEKFCELVTITKKDFWQVMDKWYNTDFFEQDKDGVWHEKFKVGHNMI